MKQEMNFNLTLEHASKYLQMFKVLKICQQNAKILLKYLIFYKL